ncbi:MAG: mate-domain-containing protein [Piptocephalis tieghemiana]|nr:MAG: mate-domain-containing protein [Piptocephalis tieghemiana]
MTSPAALSNSLVSSLYRPEGWLGRVEEDREGRPRRMETIPPSQSPEEEDQLDEEECAALLHLTWPIIFSYLLQQSIQMASILSLGHLGSEELAASALGNMFLSVTGWSLAIGMATALDTLGAQSYTGAKSPTVLGIHLQRAILFMLLLSIPISALWWSSPYILGFILRDQEQAKVVHLAGLYIRYSIPSIIPYFLFECLKKFLQAQGIMRASTILLLIVSPINALSNYLLVWSPPPLSLGFIGAPLATSLTYWILLSLGCAYIRWVNGSKGWGGWSREAFRGWWPFLRLGIPGVIMVCSEWWAFEVIALAASYLGTIPLAAQSVMLTTSSLFYMVPLGLSIAASTRIGHLLGEGRPAHAHLAAKCALLLASLLSLVNTTTLYSFRNYWGWLFNPDPQVINLVAQVIPIVAMYQMADGLSGVCGGILRGIGRQHIGAIYSLTGYYLLALPIGIWLAFPHHMGLHGLWLGLCGALFFVALGEVHILSRTNWHEEERLCRERVHSSVRHHGEEREVATFV